MKPLWKVLLWSLGISLVGYALSVAPLKQILAILGHIRLPHLVYLTLLNLGIVVLFALRWWFLLRQYGYHIPFLRAVQYRLAAFGVSYFTPGPQFGGEPVQVLAVTKRHGVPLGEALAALSLDKLLELLANFTFLAVGAMLVLSRGDLTPLILALVLVLALLPWLYLAALFFGKKPLTRLIPRKWFGRFKPWVRLTEGNMMAYCQQKPFSLIVLMLLSALVWVALVGEYWLMLHILGAAPAIRDVLTYMVAARLAFLTPLPGGIGALEAGQELAAQALGMTAGFGVSVSLLIRGRDIFFGLVGFAFANMFVHTSKTGGNDV